MSEQESDPRAKQILRVEVSSRKQDQLRAAVREMLSGYPYLGSLASSDSIAYHGVRTNKFRWMATDGVSVFLNDTPDGFFSDPGFVPVPNDVPADLAAAQGLVPGQQIDPNPHSDQRPMTADERVFGVAHEILHIAREDVLWKEVFARQGWVPVPRSAEHPEGRAPFDGEVFEDTADAQINAALRSDGVGKAPDSAYFDESISWDMPFGDAYAVTYAKKIKPPPGGGKSNNPPPQGGQGNPPPPQGGGGGGQGPRKGNQGGGDILQPGQGGDPFDPSTDPNDPSTQPGDARAAAEKIEQGRAEREAMHKRAQQTARQMGSGTSAVETMVMASRAPQVDWRSYIHGFLSRAGGVSAWDWQRPARPPLLRADPFFQPARGGHGVGHIVIACDTSGSIQVPEHRVFLATVGEVLESLRPKRVTIVFCDTAIQRIDEDVDNDTDFAGYSIPFGGGTSFVPPFEWANKLDEEEKPDALLYLTDLEGNAPKDAPDYPVLWCNINPRRQRPVSGGQWGEVVPIPVAELQPDA